MTRVSILRLGHRPGRDMRMSTHIGLVARAFGANEVIFSDRGINDIQESIKDVNKRWGGSIRIRTAESWREEIEDWINSGGITVHLTMYGLSIEDVISEIRGNDVLVIIGSSKVSSEVFNMVDYNIAIGNQPHSEVAALAVFLDRLFKGSELDKEFSGGKIRILPSKSGKKVEKK